VLLIQALHSTLYITLSPLQTCMVCSRSKHGLFHSSYLGVKGLKVLNKCCTFDTNDDNKFHMELQVIPTVLKLSGMVTICIYCTCTCMYSTDIAIILDNLNLNFLFVCCLVIVNSRYNVTIDIY